MSSVSTHVLDLVRGGPAQGVAVRLDRQEGGGWIPVTAGQTDADGRIGGLVPRGEGRAGIYRIRFDTGGWFAATGTRGFYPHVEVVFEVPDGDEHYHVPLLLGPYGYSTYRGS
jgi:5-hydroxyisourate hydrolase